MSRPLSPCCRALLRTLYARYTFPARGYPLTTFRELRRKGVICDACENVWLDTDQPITFTCAGEKDLAA